MARIKCQMLREQAPYPSLFSNRRNMVLFAEDSLIPALVKIFKDVDSDIYLENYTMSHENVSDDWSIRYVDFEYHIPEVSYFCGKCYIAFENGVTVSTYVAANYPYKMAHKLPGSSDIIKSVLKYNKKPIIFPVSPESLLDTFAFFNDMDGIEAVLDAYKSVISVNSIDCALNKLTEKEEVNGEMVALLLEFKSQYFGFQESDGLSL